MKMMIRLIMCAALISLRAADAGAQDEPVAAGKLPQKVMATLKARFPGASITTATKTVENGGIVYDVEMTRNGRKHEMDVREDGSIVNFENEIGVKDLPRAVIEAVNAAYPQCTITEAMEVMVIKNQKDTVEEYEVLIVTAGKKELELTVSPDGKSIEAS